MGRWPLSEIRHAPVLEFDDEAISNLRPCEWGMIVRTWRKISNPKPMIATAAYITLESTISLSIEYPGESEWVDVVEKVTRSVVRWS